jgi:hypothetical protein
MSLEKRLEKVMTALDDLNQAVAAVGTTASSLSTAVAGLIAELLQSGGTSAEIEAATAQVQGVNTTLTNLLGTIPPPPSSPQAFDPASNLALYSYLGAPPVPSDWTAVTDVTGTGGETLYTFSGDTAGAAPTGAQAGVWVPYTGALTTV